MFTAHEDSFLECKQKLFKTILNSLLEDLSLKEVSQGVKSDVPIKTLTLMSECFTITSERWILNYMFIIYYTS